jgi:F420-non-reducing hydrogenase small subunit
MSDKPKVAFYWCASCGGCEETIVDLNVDVLKVVDAVDIVLWPVALDFKRKHIEAMQDGEIAVSFINGAVRLSEQLEWVELLRQKSGLVVAFGSCAHLGGIPGLGNVTNRELVFERKYIAVPTADNPGRVFPSERVVVDGWDVEPSQHSGRSYELELPAFFDTVRTLDQCIDVDYYLPGCPPPSNLVWDAVMAILEGRLPDRGAILSPNRALCDTCDRNESKPDELTIREFKRVATSTPEPDECFLAQGYICLGPATRSGCGERCLNGNMPCRGCFGPPDGVTDQGAKILSAIASIVAPTEEEEVVEAIGEIADPLGTFYRFSLPSSLLGRTRLPLG